MTRFEFDPPALLRGDDGEVVGELRALDLDLVSAAVVRSGSTGVERRDRGQPSGPPHIERSGRNAAEAGYEQPEHVAAAGNLDRRETAAAPEQPSLLGDEAGSGHGEPPEAPAVRDKPLAVWLHYVEVMQPRIRKGMDPAAALDESTRKIIRDALKVAATIGDDDVAVCNQAIDGCAASAFHMGKEPPHRYRGGKPKKYDRVAQILKGRPRNGETTRDRLMYFIDIAEKAGVQRGASSADYERVQQAKLEVIAAYEFPGDDLVVERGGEAARWLAENGWVVDVSAGKRPAFRVRG